MVLVTCNRQVGKGSLTDSEQENQKWGLTMKANKIALGTVVVLLSISLWANFVYSSENGNLTNLTADLNGQISNLNLQLSQTSSQIENLTSQKAALESEVKNLKIEKASLQTQLASDDSEIERLETQLFNSASDLETLKEQSAKLQAQLTYFQNRTIALFPFEETERSKVLDSSPIDTAFLITRLGVKDIQDSSPKRLFIQGNVHNIGTATANNARLHVILYQGNSTMADFVIDLGTLEVYTSKSVSYNHQYSGNPLSGWDIIPEFG